MINVSLFGLLLPTRGVLMRGNDCVYDSMHTVGGTIAPCEYAPKIVASVTIGDGSTPAFDVDGAHLESNGAMKYIKEIGGYSDFMKCSSPECPELSGN